MKEQNIGALRERPRFAFLPTRVEFYGDPIKLWLSHFYVEEQFVMGFGWVVRRRYV